MFFVDAPVRTFYFDLDMTNEELIVKIKVEIDKRYADYREKMKTDDFTYYEGMADALDLFEQFIDTLESEKPMELNEEIKRFVAEYGYERSEDILLIAIVARQFYELGCHRTAEKYDEIEYNRQRWEEKSMNPERLEEELERFIESGKSVTVDDYGTYKVSYHDFKKVARHFAEWGAEHLKK